MSPIRLTVELVPASCWYSNVRSRVSKAEWDKIRYKVYEKAKFLCEICGGRGPKHPIEAHEIWEYNDDSLVQKLVGMIGLCPQCHAVKHIGRAALVGQGPEARLHLAKVNGWTQAETTDYVDEQFAVWQSRSEKTWVLDISALDDYLR